MKPLVLTPDLLRRAEQFNDQFHLARMRAGADAWPELGIEIRMFGPLTAIRAESPFLRSKNRILGLNSETLPHLPEALAFFVERQLPVTATLPYDGWNAPTFDALIATGMRSAGNAMPLAAAPQPYEHELKARLSPLEEKDVYLDLYRQAFDARWPVTEEELRFQWTEDTLPGTLRFIAEIDDRPVAMASLAIMDGVAYHATCGVLLEFRRQGIQQAMIRTRLNAAFSAGCPLALGGGRLFSPPRRNFERCGFAPLPLGLALTYERP